MRSCSKNCPFYLSALLLIGCASWLGSLPTTARAETLARPETIVGTTAAVNVTTEALAQGGIARKLLIGDNVIFDEVIRTSESGMAQLLFLDETALTVGPNSEIIIDRYVYDPTNGQGEILLTVSKGLMRFVGGKISKNPGAVRIQSPAASIGLRGGIGLVEVEEESGQTDLVFLFGVEATLQNDQGLVRLRKPGWSARVLGPNQRPYDLGATDALRLSRTLKSFEGIAPQEVAQIDEGEVESSQIAKSGSGNSPDALAAAQGDLPIESADLAALNDQSERDLSVQQSASDASGGDSGLGYVFSGRYTATLDPDLGYRTISGKTIDDPIASNYLGGSLTHYSRTFGGAVIEKGKLTFTAPGGGISGGPRGNQGDLVSLPIQTGFFTIGQSATYSSLDTQTPFGPVEASGFLSEDFFFFFYELEELESPGNRGFIVGGRPTMNREAFQSNAAEVRVYSLRDDAAFGAGPSFLDPSHLDIGGSYGESKLLVIQPETGFIGDGGGTTKAVYASAGLSRSGADQSSFIYLATGQLDSQADGRLAFSAEASGSVRTAGDQAGELLYGALYSLPDQEGYSFFGPDLDYFAIDSSGRLDNGTYVGDDGGAVNLKATENNQIAMRYTEPTGGGRRVNNRPRITVEPVSRTDALNQRPAVDPWSYRHVASLQTVRAPGSRSSGDLFGYAAAGGVGQTNGLITDPYVMTSLGTPEGVFIEKVPSQNGLVAVFSLINPTGTSNDGPLFAALVFGDGTGNNGGSNDVYIDDGKFAARASQTSPSFFLNNTSSNDPSFASSAQEGALTTAGLVNLTSLGGVANNLCDCEYLSWGVWSMRADWEPGANTSRRDLFHFGSFVTGDLPAPSELAGIGGVATYEGHVLGNVVNNGSQYVASGRFTNVWNFDARSGEITISGFDGQDYSGFALSQNARDYSGAVQNSGASRIGTLNGSFFKGEANPAAATGGQIFITDNASYSAAGTFAAELR